MPPVDQDDIPEIEAGIRDADFGEEASDIANDIFGGDDDHEETEEEVEEATSETEEVEEATSETAESADEESTSEVEETSVESDDDEEFDPENLEIEEVEEVEETTDPHPLRRQLGEVGRELKSVKAEKVELELELDRLREENAGLKDASETAAATQAVDLKNHPEITALTDPIIRARDALAIRLGDKAQYFNDNANTLVAKYVDVYNATGEEKIKLHQELHREVYNALVPAGEYEDPLAEGQIPPADGQVDRVIDFLQAQAPKLSEAKAKANELQNRAKSKTLEVGVAEYESQLSGFTDTLNSLGDLPDEYIEENPFKVDAAIAKRSKNDPKFASMVKKVKQGIMEGVFGKKPFTQTEIDKIVANHTGEGDPLSDVTRGRAEKVKRAREWVIKEAFKGALISKEYERVTKELQKFKESADQESAELDALGKATKRDRDPGKVPKTRPKDQPSASEKLINDIFG